PELTDIFGTMPAGDVQSVSFEYRSVALTRPWLPKRLFQSRFWRLGPGGGELSDGAQPSASRCPAYITALVFARNVQVTYRQIGGGRPPPPRSWTLLTLNPTQLRTDSTQLKMARFAVAPAASGTASTIAAPVAKMLQAARPMTL